MPGGSLQGSETDRWWGRLLAPILNQSWAAKTGDCSEELLAFGVLVLGKARPVIANTKYKHTIHFHPSGNFSLSFARTLQYIAPESWH
jgi:hypothetical protein